MQSTLSEAVDLVGNSPAVKAFMNIHVEALEAIARLVSRQDESLKAMVNANLRLIQIVNVLVQEQETLGERVQAALDKLDYRGF